jgi:hypothetical protein
MSEEIKELINNVNLTIENLERVIELDSLRSHSLIISNEDYKEEYNDRMRLALEDLMDSFGMPEDKRNEYVVSEEGLITGLILVPLILGGLAFIFTTLYKKITKYQQKIFEEKTSEITNLINRLNVIETKLPASVEGKVKIDPSFLTDKFKLFLNITDRNDSSLKKVLNKISDYVLSDIGKDACNNIKNYTVLLTNLDEHSDYEGLEQYIIIKYGGYDGSYFNEELIGDIIKNNANVALVDLTKPTLSDLIPTTNKLTLDKKIEKELDKSISKTLKKKNRSNVTTVYSGIDGNQAVFISEQRYHTLPEKFNYRYIKSPKEFPLNKLSIFKVKPVKEKKPEIFIKENSSPTVVVRNFNTNLITYKKDMYNSKTTIEKLKEITEDLERSYEIIKQVTTKITGQENGLTNLFIFNLKNVAAMFEYVTNSMETKVEILTDTVVMLEKLTDSLSD